jgi:hypothetical protein
MQNKKRSLELWKRYGQYVLMGMPYADTAKGLHPLVTQGCMPNLLLLMHQGVFADLESRDSSRKCICLDFFYDW